jgi:hypothetical protein
MKTFWIAILILACPIAPATAQGSGASAPVAVPGRLLFDANGKRIGPIYKVTSDGAAQIVADDQRLVTVPATTISQQEGKLTTSLTKQDIFKAR